MPQIPRFNQAPAPLPQKTYETSTLATEANAICEQIWSWAHHSNTDLANDIMEFLKADCRKIEDEVMKREQQQALARAETARANEIATGDRTPAARYKIPIGWVQIGEDKFVPKGTRAVQANAGWPTGWVKGSDGLWEEVGDEDEL